MKQRMLVGISLIGVGSLSGGYALGITINDYLPDVLLLKIPIFLLALGSSVYLMVKNKGYASDALQDKSPLQK